MEIDSKRQKKAKEYSHVLRRILFIELGIASIGMAVILAARLDKWLGHAIQGAASWLPPLNWQPQARWFPLQSVAYFRLSLSFILYLPYP